jgi:hypothetical protein
MAGLTKADVRSIVREETRSMVKNVAALLTNVDGFLKG